MTSTVLRDCGAGVAAVAVDRGGDGAPHRRCVTGETTRAVLFHQLRYTGVSGDARRGQSCGSILAYLNNPNSSGKGYCGGTSIRGGWQQASCE
jgi:hypothetical protein